MMESLIAFKRAGADGVLTYFAPRVAEKLKARNSFASSIRSFPRARESEPQGQAVQIILRGSPARTAG